MSECPKIDWMYWLFTSWVDRACENFLIVMASRIGNDERRIS
jgi:hypothetical protein